MLLLTLSFLILTCRLAVADSKELSKLRTDQEQLPGLVQMSDQQWQERYFRLAAILSQVFKYCVKNSISIALAWNLCSRSLPFCFLGEGQPEVAWCQFACGTVILKWTTLLDSHLEMDRPSHWEDASVSVQQKPALTWVPQVCIIVLFLSV